MKRGQISLHVVRKTGGDNWIFRRLLHFYAANSLIKLHCYMHDLCAKCPKCLKIQYWLTGASLLGAPGLNTNYNMDSHQIDYGSVHSWVIANWSDQVQPSNRLEHFETWIVMQSLLTDKENKNNCSRHNSELKTMAHESTGVYYVLAYMSVCYICCIDEIRKNRCGPWRHSMTYTSYYDLYVLLWRSLYVIVWRIRYIMTYTSYYDV